MAWKAFYYSFTNHSRSEFAVGVLDDDPSMNLRFHAQPRVTL